MELPSQRPTASDGDKASGASGVPGAPGAAGAGPGALFSQLAANRRSWDERVPIHAASRFYDVERWLEERPGPRPREVEALGDVADLDLVHLQCHFGLDTLAWADVGARVTGIDFSPAAVGVAQDLATRAGLADRSNFVCADVDEAAETLAPRMFDVVYVSLGALCWLPSVGRWADQVAALARTGGRLYLHDGHPLAWSLADDSLTLTHSYFEETDPYVDDSASTYTDADVALSNSRTYEWNHGLGEVLSSLIERGMRIDRLAEHDWTVHQRFPWLVETTPHQWSAPAGQPRLPLSFTVVATKEA
ncbi:MAG: class I SAM-dependent methyltransferase [Acidimicrobiales bacterium]